MTSSGWVGGWAPGSDDQAVRMERGQSPGKNRSFGVRAARELDPGFMVREGGRTR